MHNEESTYSGYDGMSMYMQSWLPDKEPRAVILGIHGLTAHSGRLEFVGRYFAERGFAFYAPDLRGYGRFEGTMGHVDSFDEYTDDLHSIVSYLNLKYDDKQLFLFGHSMGGLLATRYSIAYPDTIAGSMLCCPAVSERLEVSPILRKLAFGLSRLNIKLHIDAGFNEELASRNPEVVRDTKEDPLRYKKVTPRFIAEGLTAKDEAFESAERLSVPVIVSQSGNDKILLPEKTMDFYERIASNDKTWKMYDGFYHYPFEDEGGHKMLDDLVEWLEERI